MDLHVLIVIDLASRREEIGGIAHEPTGAWMMHDCPIVFTDTTRARVCEAACEPAP